MAGIYIHIPFCKTRCNYCDFFKSTNVSLTGQFLKELSRELKKRKNFFEGDEKVDTIYFGGGTPSLLTPAGIYNILEIISQEYHLNHRPEISLEANPDDLTPEYLQEVQNAGINRLSIGVQSFHDVDLQKMGRRHSAKQSHQVLKDAFSAGFDNIGIDLIYGLPWSSPDQLKENLQMLGEYPVKHLSAYHLTIEPNTFFGREKSENKLSELTDTESEKLFNILREETSNQGFYHYEISNFCKDGWYSKHNTAYWNGKSYLGVGPGAHSYNGKQRFINLPDIHQYIHTGYEAGISSETLREKDHFNETLMLGLRTRRGIHIEKLRDQYPDTFKNIEPQLKKWIQQGFLTWENDRVFSTDKGWFVIDGIIEDLFIL